MLRPLASDKRVISVRAEGEMNGEKSLNPDSPRYGYRASGTYVDQFADDTFGIAIGVSASQIPSQDQRYNAWGYSGSGTAADPLVLGGAKPYVQSNNLKRYGGVATIEWKPSDRFHSTFDALYSHFTENQILRGIEFPLGFGSDTSHVNNTVVDDFATSTTFTGVHAVQRNDTNRRKANNYSLGWNNVVALNSDDTMHFTVDASWSHAKRTDFLLETYTGTGYNKTGVPDTVTVTQQPNGIFQIVPTLDYSNTNQFQITDPQGWGYNGTTAVVQSGFLNKPTFKDDLKALRASLDGEFEHSVIKGWEAGVNYSERKKTSAFTSYFLCPKGGGTDCTVASGTPTSEPVPAGRGARSPDLARLSRRAEHPDARSALSLQQLLQRGVRQPSGFAGARQRGEGEGVHRLRQAQHRRHRRRQAAARIDRPAGRPHQAELGWLDLELRLDDRGRRRAAADRLAPATPISCPA